MQPLTGVQAVKAIGAWAVIATVVPLFGILLIPVLALATMGRTLVGAASTVAKLMRPAAERGVRVTTPGIYGWLR